MKTKLQRILNHPVAKIVAFVPIVNWLYVILFLMCSDLRRFGKFCICIFVSGLLAKLLRVVIPAPFDWLVPYPISCVNAVFCLYELTKKGALQDATTKRLRWRLILCGVVLAALIGMIVTVSTKYDLDGKTTAMLEAIVQQDDRTWENLQTKALEIGTLDDYSDALAQDGIDLHGEVQKLLVTGVSYRSETEAGTTVTQSFLYRIGGKLYRVSVNCLEFKRVKGLVKLTVERVW